jgi:uncharacterized repeat protein (TIGR01451 family)
MRGWFGHFKGIRSLGSVAITAGLVVGSVGSLTGGSGPAAAAAGQVTGTVFQDYNSNGVKDTGATAGTAVDKGVQGISVRAFDDAGVAYGPTASAADGTYTLTVPAGARVRVEFEIPSTPATLAAYKPSFGTTGSGAAASTLGTSVQFATSGDASVDFPINIPGDYCQDNPDMCITVFSPGQIPSPGLRGIETFPLSRATAYNQTTTPTVEATHSAVGTTYGLAWDDETRMIFAGAYMRRKSAHGPSGAGAVYKVDPATNATTLFATVPGVATDPHPQATTNWNRDTASAALVGKSSLGDIDISPDNTKLYVMNMENKTVYVYDPAATAPASALSTWPVNLATISDSECPDVDVRPMGMGVRTDGQLFVGAVCSAQTANDRTKLRAYVWSVSAAGVYSLVMNQALVSTTGINWAPFQPWTDAATVLESTSASHWTTPMLSDIEFDGSELIIGVRDRTNDQVPGDDKIANSAPWWRPSGDIRRACLSGTMYILDGQTGCGTAGAEWYSQDLGSDDPANNDENGMGALAQVPGRPGVVVTDYDPRAYSAANVVQSGIYSENGVQYLSNTPGGGNKGGYAVLSGDSVASYFSKTNGLGDLEALCDRAPLQVGNRVWKDVDGDGIQGATESGIAGVTVQLYAANGTTLLGTAKTNADGEYYFSSNLTEAAAGNGDYLGGGLPVKVTTVIRLGLATDYSAGPLAGLGLTATDAVATPATVLSDSVDNDATVVGGFAQISVPSLAAGDNNHTYDFGFKSAVYDLALVKVSTTTSVSAVGDDISWTIRVQNQGGVNSGAFSVADKLAAGTTYNTGSATFAVGGTGQTAIGTPTPSVTATGATFAFTGTGLIPGGYVDITLTTKVTDITKAPFRNWAEISAESGTDVDSTPNSNAAATSAASVDPYTSITALADAALNNFNATDQDDSDDAVVASNTFDLALRETVVSQTKTSVGLKLEIFNQGVGTVHAIDVTQYIDAAAFATMTAALNPAGSSGAPLDPAYTAPGTALTYTWDLTDPAKPKLLLVGDLAPGQSITVPVNLVLKTPGALPASVTIAAEISQFRNLAGSVLTDIDSTPDATNSDVVVDDIISSTPTGTPADEDDHDIVTIPLYDLALIAVPSPTQPGPLAVPGQPDLVSYDITVTNQGGTPVYLTQVTTTPPTGATFDSVTGGASGSGTTFSIPTIPAGGSVTFTVVYKLADTSASAFKLIGEVSAFDNDANAANTKPVTVVDIDSTPDTNPANDAGGAVGTASDNVITGDGTGAPLATVAATDEDDADPAVITLPYDLALQVRLDPTDPAAADGISSGEVIKFYVEIFNQGRDISSIDFTQYVPASSGFVFDPAKNPGATTVAGTYDTPASPPAYTWVTTDPLKPVAKLTGVLAGGQSVRIPVYLTVTTPPASDAFTTAEILVARDALNNPVTDKDSTPDNIDGNDLLVDDIIDNTPTSATNPDEDDHDIAYIKWWDLALIKTSADYVLDGSTAVPQATFTVTVKNQGVATAYNVNIIDTAPAGTVISSMTSSEIGSVCTIGTGVCSFDGAAGIAGGATVTITVVLDITDKTIGSYENFAEITSLKGLLDLGTGAGPLKVPVSDIDSVPDTNPANDVLFLNAADANDPRNSHNTIDFITGVTSLNMPNPADEDDHDAQVVVFPLAVGDYVWYDVNHNGAQDAGELPVVGASVTLLMDDGTGTFVDALDASGFSANSTPVTTDSNGWYVFDNLVPGTYKVVFEHGLSQYLWTVADSATAPNDASDSDAVFATKSSDATASTAPFKLAIGQPNVTPVVESDGPLMATNIDRTRDAGIWMPVAVGYFVWYDVNHDGIQGPIADEPAVEGVTVTLYNPDGTPAVKADGTPATAITDVDGTWVVDNLIIGSYYAVFSTLPAGWVPTTQLGSGTTSTDSNADATGQTPVFVLDPATNRAMNKNSDTSIIASFMDPTIDMGLFKPVSLGDVVWFDANHDGIYDTSTEKGVAGVKVELVYVDGSPANHVDGNPVAAATTDANGRYSFTDLLPGDYMVNLTLPAFTLWTLPNQGGNESFDSDLDWNVASEPVSSSDVFTVSALTQAIDNDPNGLALTEPRIDAGIWVPFAIGDYLWYDLDHNGVQDAGEKPVVGAVAHLLMKNGAGAWVAATNANNGAVADFPTSADGRYIFDNLLAGTYRVEFTHGQAGYLWTAPNSGSTSDAKDSDATFAASADAKAVTGDIVLAVGQANVRPALAADGVGSPPVAIYIDPTNEAGIWMPVAVGDYVWYDGNRNGIQDAGELPVEAVKVSLLKADGTLATDADGSPVAAVFTDATGKYVFGNLLPGDYKIQFSGWPSGFSPTKPLAAAPATAATDSNPDAAGLTPVFTLSPSVTGNMTANANAAIVGAFIDKTIDMGIFQAVTLGDLVWYDANRDGIFDPATEKGMAGVKVDLLMEDPANPGAYIAAKDADGIDTAQQTTNVDGRYSFVNLAAGNFKVVFTLPSGYQWTKANTPADDTLDNDGLGIGTAATSTTGVIALKAIPPITDSDPKGLQLTNPSVDAGVWLPMAIGDFVWFDMNRNGIQDGTEANVSGAIVTLTVDNGTGTFVSAKDADGIAVGPFTTGANGLYLFDNLLPGTYKVEFTHGQAGYLWTKALTGAAATDSDATFSLESDAKAMSPAITLSTTATRTHAVTALDTAKYGTLKAIYLDSTIDAGIWILLAVGNYVWEDVDHNGTQDGTAVELPVPGMTATLLNAADGSAVLDADGVAAVATTDATGKYVLDRLLPGTYIIQFGNMPLGWSPTYANVVAATDAKDSDADPATLKTGSFTLAPAVAGNMVANTDPAILAAFIDPTVDLGLHRAATLGDLVWYDLNHNGVYDAATEVGIAGIKVDLLKDDGTGVFKAANDTDGFAVPQATTDVNGRYSFNNLAGGNYKVVFTLPTGYEWTTSNKAAANDSLDSDAVFTTTTDATAMTLSYYVDYNTAVVDGDTNAAHRTVNNPTIDAGVWLPMALGDIVWIDANHNGVQDTGELPVKGATAHLLMDDGTGVYLAAKNADGGTITDVITGANGLYLFDNLLPGKYKVEFSTIPAGYRWTTANAAAGFDAKDSDAVFAGTELDAKATTGIITLGMTATNTRPATAADDTTYGAPLRANYIDPTNDAGIWMSVAVGNYVWLDYNSNGVQDASEVGVGGVTVTLLNADGTAATNADGTPVLAIVTPSTGFYYFGNLLPGSYKVQFSTLPAGHTPTTLNAGTDVKVDSNADPVTLMTALFTLTLPNAAGAPTGNMVANDNAAIGYLIDPTIDMGLVLTPSIVLKKYVTTPALSVAYNPEDSSTLGCDAPSLPTDGSKPDACQIMAWGGSGVYRIAVTNNGYIALTAPNVTDSVLVAPEVCSNLRLISPAVAGVVFPVGATWVYQCETTDVRHHFTNQSTVTAYPAMPDGSAIPGQAAVTSQDVAVVDPAQLVVELGLDKTMVVDPTPGGIVEWDIAITNAGPDVAWGPVTVVDDLPVGFIGLDGVSAGWTCTAAGVNNRRITCVTTANILVNVVQTIHIRAQITPDLPGAFRNEAYFAAAGIGNPIVNPQNSGTGVNAGGLAAFPVPTDTVVNPYLTFAPDVLGGTLTNDTVPVRIFDLAETIVYTSDTAGAPTDGKVSVGQSATFTVTVFNQGSVDATGVEVSVYVPAGFALNDPAWTMVGDRAVLTDHFALAAAAQVTHTITLKAIQSITADVMVFSEITDASNAFNLLDWDSTLDTVQANDRYLTDNSVAGNGKGSGDEDDADPALIKLYVIGRIPVTGSQALLLLQIAGLLAFVGGGLVLIGRARRRRIV